MRTLPENESTASRVPWLLTAIVAALALGAGVTGTLLWVQNRPVAPAATLSPAATSSPVASQVTSVAGVPTPENIPIPQVHNPPAELTAGMTRPQAALTLGNWNYDHEQWARAVQEYRRAIAGGINNPNVRTDLGNALRFSNQPQKALEQYQIAQRLDPTHEQSLFNQGALYASSLGNTQKGVQMWRTYLQRFPNGASADAARSLIAQAQNAG